MHNLILGICGVLFGLLPQKSLAQLDLEDILTPAVQTADDESATTADSTKDEVEITAETVSEISETDDTPATAADESTQTSDFETPEIPTVADDNADAEVIAPDGELAVDKMEDDDFMAQYIDDLSTQEQQKDEADKIQSDAMRLIMQKDNSAVLADDDTKVLFEKSAEIRQKQMEQLQKNTFPEINFTVATPNPPETAEDTKTAPQEDTAEETNEPVVQEIPAAPFGLTWGASREQTEAAGFELQEVDSENYAGAMLVKNPQQKRAVFDKVTAVFGEHDHLQIIYAQSPLIKDTPQADKVLQLYHDYCEALTVKYGNSKEHFYPNKESSGKIGNDNFLEELKEEKAVLYTSFDDGAVKITISVYADSEARSYIEINYKNTQIQQQEREENLNELVSDL